MKTFICILIISLQSLSIFGQWTTLNSGSTEKLNTVYFTSDNVGYAGGSGVTNATLLKTIDGGTNWFPLTINTIHEIVSIFFTSPDTGFVLNYNNELYKTTDGGNNWLFKKQFWGYTGKIYFTSNLIGYVGVSDGVQGIFHKTYDEGNTWTDSVTVTGMSNVTALHFPSSSIGYAVSFGGKIAKTLDAGLSWSELTQPTTKPLMDVFFTSDNVGYTVGGDGLSSVLLKTINGGNDWTLQTTSPPTMQNHEAVFFTEETTGYCGNGYIYKTINSGTTWNPMTSNGQILDLFFPSSTIGYAVGYSGLILKLNSTNSINEDMESDEIISFFPNPTNNQITVSITQDVGFLIIYDLNGKEIDNYNTNQNEKEIIIDVAKYENGVYTFLLGNQNQKISLGRFIVNK